MRPKGVVVTERTNEEWLKALSMDGHSQEIAITDLRILLKRGLQRGLLGRVDTAAPEFETQAEDFVQEALLKILAKLDSFAGRSKFTTWAHKITVHVALSELRRKRWKDSSLEQLTERDDSEFTPSFTADPAPQPDSVAERRDILAHINRIIEEDLTDKQRTVMQTSVIQGRTTQEVAKLMDMKPNAVYKLLHDARLRLKKRLEEENLPPSEIMAVFRS